jgi:hypothetical protein
VSRSNRLSISLEAELYDALALEAEEQGRSLADVTRDHLRAALLGKGPDERVGKVAEELIREGLPNEIVLERVLKHFPDARTSDASIRWYRSRLRQAGENVPSQVEARRNWTL